MPPTIGAIFDAAFPGGGWWITSGVLTVISGLVAYGGWLASQADREGRRRGLPPALRALSAWLWFAPERWERRYDRLEEYLAAMDADGRENCEAAPSSSSAGPGRDAGGADFSTSGRA